MNSYMKQTRICSSVKISGGGKRLLFIVSMSWIKELLQTVVNYFVFPLGLFSFPSMETQQQRDPVDAAAVMKALFPLSRTRSDWLLLACTIYLTSLSSHSAVTACVRDVHILRVCACVYVMGKCVFAPLQFCPGSYSVEQVMILLLTRVLMKLIMSV